MQINRDVARRFKGAINSLCTVSASSTAEKRSAQRWSLVRSAASVLCLVVLMFATQAHAQMAGAGSIQGVVTDPNGAVIPNAVVTLTEQSTQVTLTTKTTTGGDYAFPNIQTGTYSVTVAAPGFQGYSSTNNVLEVGSSIALNAQLTVGAADTKIEVRSNGLSLQTEDATYKQTVDAQEITELPLNGRRMTDLLAGAGATVSAGGGDFSKGSKYSYASVSYAVAGGMGNSLEYRLDGASNDDYMAGSNLPFPFPDAVGQFSLETATLGAQNSSSKVSGVVNVVTKSGTNHFHGNAFEFIRNNYFDATVFYAQPCVNGNRPPNCGKDTLHLDQYGGTLGGPLLKDKLFLFGGFQYTRSKEAKANSYSTVPTAANILQGDFTAEAGTPAIPAGPGGTPPAVPAGAGPLAVCGTKATQLVDPQTGNLIPGNVYAPGTLPTWNQTTLNVLKLLPYVSTTGSNAYTLPALADHTEMCGRVQYSLPVYSFDKQFVTRADYSINGSNHLYARYMLDSYQNPPLPYSPTNIILTSSGNVNPEQRVQTFALGEDHTFSANLVNTAHAAILRRTNARSYAPGSPNPCDIKIGANISCGSPLGTQLSVSSGNLAQGSGLSIGNGSAAQATFNDNTLALTDDVTYLHGKHQFVFGGEFVRNQLNINNCFQCLASFNFNSSYSSYGPYGSFSQQALNPTYVACTPPKTGNCAPTQNGDAELDFLEGAQNSFTQGKYQQNALRTNYPSVYAQDTYHASPRLTIVGGVRWQPFYPAKDTKNRGAIFNMANFMSNTTTTQFCQTGQPACLSPLAPTAPGPTAGFLFYGDPGVPQTFTKSSPYQFEPTFGVTYDLSGNGKTVVRAGVSYVYDIPNNFTLARVNYNPPFATSITQSLNTYTPFTNPWSAPTLPTNSGPGAATPLSTLFNPFPTNSSLQGVSPVFFPNGAQYVVPVSQYKPAQYLQYTASIQQQFPRGWTLNLQYIGNGGHHEPWGNYLNGPVFIPGTSNGTASASNCNVNINGTNYWLGEFAASAAAPAAGALCSTTGNEGQRGRLIMINPAQGNKISTTSNASLIANSIAVSSYNGLVVSVNHRLSSTFSVLANYTWSKCLDEVDNNGDQVGPNGEDNNNPALDYGPCGFDYRNVASFNVILKSAFHIDNRLESAIINGWQLGTTSVLSTGGPFSVTVGADSDLIGNPGGDRASRIAGVPLYAKVPLRQGSGAANRQYLNPAAFNTNTASYLTPSTAAAPIYGNTGRNAFHGPSTITLDSQLSRFWKLHEGLNLDTRIEGYNILNHPNFANPDGNTKNGTFGQISGTSVSTARVFQAVAKIIF